MAEVEGLSIPPIPEPKVMGATHYNAGVFGGGHHDELAASREPSMNAAELLAARAIAAYLGRHKRVAFVDLGAMCGLSATILAAQFSRDIKNGHLLMVATEQEKEYSIQNLLNEAKKRITLEPVRTKLLHIDKATLDSGKRQELTKALERTKQFVTPGELAYLENHHHLVHFLTGVNSDRIDQELQHKLGIKEVHFLHEHSGGFTFANNRRQTAASVANIMAPDGMIFSIVGWHHFTDDSAFLQWERKGVSVKDLTLPGLPPRPQYALYSFPDAPKVV